MLQVIAQTGTCDMSVNTAVEIAKHFVGIAAREKRDISPLKLQKLLYFAEGYHLAIHGTSLFVDEIEAWKFGPVVESVYHEFKEFGSGPIDRQWARAAFEDSDPRHEFLQRVWMTFRNWSPIELSELSHQPGGPWDQVLQENDGELRRNLPIEKDRIRIYFQDHVFDKSA